MLRGGLSRQGTLKMRGITFLEDSIDQTVGDKSVLGPRRLDVLPIVVQKWIGLYAGHCAGITCEAIPVQQTGKPAFSIYRAQPASVEYPDNAIPKDWLALTAQWQSESFHGTLDMVHAGVFTL